jgi:hypothetical protein
MVDTRWQWQGRRTKVIAWYHEQSLLFYVLVIVNVYPPWYQAITFVLRPCPYQRVSTMVSSNHFCSTSLSLSTSDCLIPWWIHVDNDKDIEQKWLLDTMVDTRWQWQGRRTKVIAWYHGGYAITFVLRPCPYQRVSTMVSSNHFCSTSLSLSTCIHHGIKQSLPWWIHVDNDKDVEQKWLLDTMVDTRWQWQGCRTKVIAWYHGGYTLIHDQYEKRSQM